MTAAELTGRVTGVALSGSPAGLSNEDANLYHQAIFDNSPDALIFGLPDGTILSVNAAACRIFGRSAEEMCAAGIGAIIDFDDPRSRKAFADREQHGSFHGEITLLRKDGTRFEGEVTYILFKDSNGRTRSAMIVRDVSESKKLADSLRWSEEKFSKAFEYNQAMMTITRLRDNMLLDINREFRRKLGYEREEFQGRSVEELPHWGDLNDRRKMLQHINEYGYISNYEVSFRKKSGEIGYALVAANLFELAQEQYLLCSAIDITERKKAADELRSSQDIFYKAFNTNPHAMFIVSMNDDTILEVNDTFLEQNACTREELIGRNILDTGFWVQPHERYRYIEKIKKYGLVRNFEARTRLHTGQEFTVLFSGVAIRWKNEPCVLSIVNDITELRRCQQEMARLDRLNVIGEMSASIAHEIRNPMSTVKGFLQLLKCQDRYADDSEYMQLMIEELDRANDIITEFLSLAKNKPIDKKPENLNDRIKALWPLLQSDATKRDMYIDLELGNISEIMIDRGEIRQLILNLVRNGLEAMSPKGRLTIKTFEDRNGVTMAIHDKGPGMSIEVQEKIGTPFFTTKPNGTGLGLPVCYSIAQRHDAVIKVTTGSQGTVFKVIFPRITPEKDR